MGLFTKKTIKVKCTCEGKSEAADGGNARFIVLGACCKKSQQTFENTVRAVAEQGLPDRVINVGDNLEIAKYGVMQTPGLVIDGKVVAYGRLLSVEDVKALIEKAVIPV